MKKLILLFILAFTFQSAFAASCRKQFKQDRQKYEQALYSIDKAVDYYDRHEQNIDRANYKMAQKYIGLTIERIKTALTRFELTQTALSETLNNCPRRSKKINSLLNEITDETEELSFQLMICEQIAIRLENY